MLVSGGVDSTVCAALLHKALGEDQVIALHIDNGFMRLNESEKVVHSLQALKVNIKGQLTVHVVYSISIHLIYHDSIFFILNVISHICSAFCRLFDH